MVFFAVDTRLAGDSLECCRHEWNDELEALILNGRLNAELQSDAHRGVRGKRPAETCEAVGKLQVQGMAKMQILRELGVARNTVDRYWRTENRPLLP